MDGRSASQTGSLPRTASLFSFIIRHLSPFLAIIQAHCLPGPQNMRWSPPPFLPSSSPTPESPRPDPANPTCCRERPEDASPPRRWDLTARPPVGGACSPLSCSPPAPVAIFNLLSFLQTFAPGWQMPSAEEPTGVFSFQDPQENYSPQPPCARQPCWSGPAGFEASLLSQAWPLQSPLFPCLQRGC